MQPLTITFLHTLTLRKGCFDRIHTLFLRIIMSRHQQVRQFQDSIEQELFDMGLVDTFDLSNEVHRRIEEEQREEFYENYSFEFFERF